MDRKMIATFFNGLGVLYHHAKFGEDRTTRAGCRCEKNGVCMFIFYLSCSEAGPLFVGGGHSSNKYCVTFYGSILMRFSLFFWKGSAF